MSDDCIPGPVPTSPPFSSLIESYCELVNPADPANDNIGITSAGFWEPEQSVAVPMLAHADGSATIGIDGYTFTASGGSSVLTDDSEGLPYDSTKRYFAKKFTSVPSSGIDYFYMVAGDADSFGAITEGYAAVLEFDGALQEFTTNSMLMNPFTGSTPTAFPANVPYAVGDELALAFDDAGTIEFYKNGTLVVAGSDTAPASVVAIGGFAASAGAWAGELLAAPMAIAGATLLVGSNGPVTNLPADREGRSVEIHNLGTGVTVPINVGGAVYLLKDGMVVDFDQNGDIADNASFGQHLTVAEASVLFAPFKKDFPGESSVPGLSEDITIGAVVGSLWYNESVSPVDVYRCTMNGIGAAQWVLTSLELTDLGSMATKSAGSGTDQFLDNLNRDLATANAIAALSLGTMSTKTEGAAGSEFSDNDAIGVLIAAAIAAASGAVYVEKSSTGTTVVTKQTSYIVTTTTGSAVLQAGNVTGFAVGEWYAVSVSKEVTGNAYIQNIQVAEHFWKEGADTGVGTLELFPGESVINVFDGNDWNIHYLSERADKFPSGTLITPPSGMHIGTKWLDTTDSGTHPILRVALATT